jgi:methylenetetrahydrofolate reductase (NADPH)
MRRLLENPRFELVPLKRVLDQAAHLPDGAEVTVTASPHKGMDATIELATQLAAKGFRAVPHLSARLIEDRIHLEAIVGRLARSGIEGVFVVGGDGEPKGEFFDGLSLFEGLEAVGHPFTEIGVPAYPEGHTAITEDKLWQALTDKQRYASYMTTQMCFDPQAVVAFTAEARTRGINLQMVVGIPGVVDPLKLMGVASRIGVGASIRFLRKNAGILRLLRPGRFNPERLIERMAEAEVGVDRLHIFTFNQIESTERWRRRVLEKL